MKTLFVTPLYQARLSETIDAAELEATCLSVAEDDEAGQAWCEEQGYPGYTSYASLSDLPWRMPVFQAVKDALDAHVSRFAEQLYLDLGEGRLELEDLWINVLPEGGTHASHIHPLSVISGTTYVAMPEGTSVLKLEDPRHSMMMASPPRKRNAPEELQSFVYLQPTVGDVLLWESWLRHEVPMNKSEGDRISVSFNYKWV
ncbi:MAG: TIGR02466 family protein [Pseudomonadota bacterium]